MWVRTPIAAAWFVSSLGLLGWSVAPAPLHATAQPSDSAENERSAVWGVLGELAGTTWDRTESIEVYRWVRPYETLEQTAHYPNGTVTYRFALNADRTAIVGEGTNAEGRTYNVQVTSPRSGVWVQEISVLGSRTVARFDNGRLFKRSETLSNGVWKSSKEVELFSLPPEAASQRLADLGRQKVENERAKALRAELERKWGILALLPGKSWFCVAYNPSQWLQRRPTQNVRLQSLPVARMTTAQWLEMGRTMQLISQQGDARWTDRIEIMPDGTFALTTVGLAALANLTGRKEPDGRVIFPTGSTREGSVTTPHSLVFGGASPYPMMSLEIKYGPQNSLAVAHCTMGEFTESQSSRFAQELEYARREEAGRIDAGHEMVRRAAEREADGAAMLSSMRASAINEFAKIPGVIAEVNNQRAELDRLRRAAEEETASSQAGRATAPATSSSVSQGASSSAASGNAATSSATRTRFTFCIEHRRAAGEEGRRKEVVFYSRVGPITRHTDEYSRDTAGFSNFVDGQTDLPRSPVSANCPQFDTQAAAEADLAMKRANERPDVRPFVYVRDYVPE